MVGGGRDGEGPAAVYGGGRLDEGVKGVELFCLTRVGLVVADYILSFDSFY